MRWIVLALLCACATPAPDGGDSPDARSSDAAPGTVSEQTREALRERNWSGLAHPDAAARFEREATGASLDWLFAAELRLLAGGRQNHFLGARDAWRWLEATGGGRQQPDVRRRRAYRLYNRNVAEYATAVNWARKADRVGRVRVNLIRNGLASQEFERVVSSYTVSTKGHKSGFVTSGAGGPVLITFPRDKARDAKWPYLWPEIYARAVCAVLDFKSGRASLTLFDPAEGETTLLFGRTVPLKIDSTAAWAYMDQRQRRDLEADVTTALTRPDGSFQSIYMLAPPDPKRKILLLVHGFNSSPRTFRTLVNMLASDAKLRANYQIAAYRYATGYSLFFSNIIFRERLRGFYDYLGRVAPEARAAGTVAIGHSMGGLQIKPMAQASGQMIWDRVFSQPPSRVSLTTAEGSFLRDALIFQPLPEIRRLVFLAVPHKGSDLAAGALGEMGKRMIVEDPVVTAFKANVLRDYHSQIRPRLRERLEKPTTSVDSLRPSDLYLNLLGQLPIRVPYHSIIADVAGSKTNPTGDGIVPYGSAHIEGAQSELIIKWGHNVPSSPACAAEVRRILLLSLE